MAADLTALAARLRAIPLLGAVIAKEAAPRVLAIAQSTAQAGTTPDGVAWAPRKQDGKPALPKAASALSVRTEGDVVVLVLSGVYVYQQKKRAILPGFGLGVPSKIADAIRDVARAVLARPA